MTDQPHAAPTPGPWHVSKAGYHTIFNDDEVIVADCDSLDPRHPPADQIEANARLIAAAPATAAERDRLLAVNEGLVGALAEARPVVFNAIDPIDQSAKHETRRRILAVVDAALAEARKP